MINILALALWGFLNEDFLSSYYTHIGKKYDSPDGANFDPRAFI
jgi:hypothetical protein